MSYQEVRLASPKCLPQIPQLVSGPIGILEACFHSSDICGHSDSSVVREKHCSSRSHCYGNAPAQGKPSLFNEKTCHVFGHAYRGGGEGQGTIENTHPMCCKHVLNHSRKVQRGNGSLEKSKVAKKAQAPSGSRTGSRASRTGTTWLVILCDSVQPELRPAECLLSYTTLCHANLSKPC